MRNLLAQIWMRLRLRVSDGWVRWRPVLASIWILVPIALIAILLAGYAWWWQQVADGIRIGASQFQLEQHAQGREAQWDDLDISGFPYQVEAQFNAPRITAPDRGFAWDGKSVVLDIAPLKPRHISFNLQGHQHLLYAKDGRLIEGGADAAKALVTIVAGAAGAEEVGLDIEGLSSQGDWNARHVELVVQNASATAHVGDGDAKAATSPIVVAATLNNIALRGDIVLPLGPAITLVDLKARFSFPNTPAAGPSPSLLAAWRATDTPVEIQSFDLDWGGVTLEAHGALKLDALARPEGRLQLKIGNHRRLLEVLTAEGWISPDGQNAIASALNTLAFMSGDPARRIDVTLRLADGAAFLELFGLVPLRVGPVGPLFNPVPSTTPG